MADDDAVEMARSRRSTARRADATARPPPPPGAATTPTGARWPQWRARPGAGKTTPRPTPPGP